MKTDILFSSPRLQFSRAQQEAVLAWAKKLGARNVPSLYALEKFQEEALATVGDPTVKVETGTGNILYMNDPMKLLERVCRLQQFFLLHSLISTILQIYAHLPTREKLHSYPELVENQVKEVWQAEKWLYETPNDVLTPMVRIQEKDFYIYELAYCTDDTWFIPEWFFDHCGKRLAIGRAARPTPVRNHIKCHSMQCGFDLYHRLDFSWIKNHQQKNASSFCTIGRTLKPPTQAPVR